MSIDQVLTDNLNLNQSLTKRLRKRTPIYDLVRWLFSSISKHFDDFKGSIPFYLEGQERESEKDSDSVELRINGPFVNNPSKGYWKIDIDVNLLVTSTIDDQDLYKIYKIIDQFLEGFTDIISIYKYGNGDDLLGCLVMRTDIEDAIIISNFGRVDPTLRILQSTINAIYSMEIEGG